MARIRTIKPEFWTDEKIVELSPTARLLFIGMWNFVDDQGRATYSISRLKMQILPAESAEIGGFLRELAEAKLIVIYTVDDKQYFQVVNFEKHQKVDRRYPSKLPPPPDEVEASPPNPAECRPRNGMEWNGTRREGKGRESSTVVDNGRARAKVETSEKARFSFSKTMHRGGSPASQTGPPNGPSQDVEKPPQTGPPEQFLEPDPLGNLVEVGIERDPGGNPVK